MKKVRYPKSKNNFKRKRKYNEITNISVEDNQINKKKKSKPKLVNNPDYLIADNDAIKSIFFIENSEEYTNINIPKA